MIDSRTTNLNFPLPNPANRLDQDAGRIATAIEMIDEKLATIDALLNSDDVDLDTLQELVDAIKGDAATVTGIFAALADKQPLLVSGTNIKTINGGSVLGTGNLSVGVNAYTYDTRAVLRTLTPLDGETITVDGLGVFVFVEGSTEPDDDESCFATANGRWLLEAVHWDVVDSWSYSTFTEDVPLVSKVTSSVNYVSATSQVSFTATVPDAFVGDAVVVTPPNNLGAGRISIYGAVTSTNTVTVYVNNPSAAAISFSAGVWTIVVFKAQ